jgi:WD40 repeat protein
MICPAIQLLAVSSDGRRAVSADAGGGIRLWDLETGKELCAYQTPGAPSILAVAFAPDGQHLVSAGDDGVFRSWRLP